jgi:hypothetical protein
LAKTTHGALTWLEALDGVLDWVLRAAAVLLLLITGYYVYGAMMHGSQLFAGANPTGGMLSIKEFQQHLANMELLTKLLLLCTVAIIVAALGRYYAAPETGGVLLLLGLLLFFGMPFVIDSMGGSGTLPKNLAKLGDPRAFLKGKYVIAGLAFAGAGLIHLIIHGIRFATGARERRPRANEESAKTAAQVKKPNDRFLGACWQLPFCRDTDKKLCPIRASKKSCWRTGRGCYCDQNVILTLSGGSQYAASRGSSGYLSYNATVAKPKSLREKREQCLQCPVYLHHQGQKYRVAIPLSLLALVGATYYYWGTISSLYPDAMRSMGRALSGFSFGPSTGGVPGWAGELASNQGIMWMLIGVAAILIITYLVQAIELALYRLGL